MKHLRHSLKPEDVWVAEWQQGPQNYTAIKTRWGLFVWQWFRTSSSACLPDSLLSVAPLDRLLQSCSWNYCFFQVNYWLCLQVPVASSSSSYRWGLLTLKPTTGNICVSANIEDLIFCANIFISTEMLLYPHLAQMWMTTCGAKPEVVLVCGFAGRAEGAAPFCLLPRVTERSGTVHVFYCSCSFFWLWLHWDVATVCPASVCQK